MNILKIFDHDQNYDLLMADNIISDIKSLIHNKLDNHFPNLYAIWLIQRKHVYSLPWAENWTNLAFDFLKPLTRTHLLDDGEINGFDYGFEPEYTANLPEALDFPDFPDEVTLKVYKGQTVSITWIERSHTYSNSLYCRKVGNYITCWHRSQKVVTAYDTDLEIKLDSRQWLINSVVIQGDGVLINITNEQKELIMYEFLDQTLEAIYSQLQISECKVLTGCDAVLTTTVSIYEQNRFLPSGTSGGPETNIAPIVSEWIEFGNPVFQKVPDNYHFAFLKTADGTTLGQQPSISFDRIYGSIFLSQTTVFSYFDEWLEDIEFSIPLGFDLKAGGAKATVLDFNTAANSEPDRALDLRTTTDNQPETGAWNVRFSPYYPASYPALHTDYWLGQIFPRSGKQCYFFGVLDFKPVRGVDYPYSDTSAFSSFNVSIDAFSVNNFNYFVDEFRVDAANTADRRKWRQRANAVVIPFLGCRDYHLFSTGQVGMLKNSIDCKTFSIEEFTPPSSPSYIPLQDRNIYTRQEYLNKSKALISVNLEDIGEAQISHTSSVEFTLFHESTDPPFVQVGTTELEGYGGTIFTVWDRNPYPRNSEEYNHWLDPYQVYDSEQIIQSITLRRDFRFQPLDPFYLTTDSDGKTVKLSNTQAANLIAEYSSPADFSPNANNAVAIQIGGTAFNFTRPFFDPDPDNGDIMPDSQRVIENHFRLEKISDWLGIAEQPDQTIKNFPDPYHLEYEKAADELAGYKIGSFQKPEGQVNAASVWEIISNRVEKDKFGDEQIKKGGLVKFFTFPQMIIQAITDIAKGLGLQEASGIQVTKGDGSGVMTFGSQLELLIELLTLNSKLSQTINGIDVTTTQIKVMNQSLLAGQGLPITIQVIPWEYDGKTGYITAPVLHPNAPSLVDHIGEVKVNLGFLVGSNLSIKEVN